MTQIRLIPSAYAVSSTSYLTVQNPENMYHNTDNTSYATITNTNASTTSRYLYIRGFNFNDIPSNAIINSFTVKIKGYESGLSTSTSYAPRLANGTSTISSTTASSNFGTSSKTITIPTGALTWSQITGYGSNFTIIVYVRRSNKNNTGYAYIQGAEILVDYTVPVYHTVDITGNTTPTGSQSILEGESLRIKYYDATKPTVTDNNVNVTSQVQQGQDSGGSYTVTNVTTQYGFDLNSNTGYYVSNNKGVDKTCCVCRVNISVPVAATITFTYINYAEQGYDFGVFGNIDTALNTNYYSAGSSGATISDSSYMRACNTSSYNSSSTQTLSYIMSAGDHYIDVKYSKDDGTSSNNDTLQFKLSITLNEPYTPETYWYYELTNITADHVVVFTAGGVTQALYFKSNGSWVTVTKAYKKVNGTWVEQNDVSQVFDSQSHYIKGGS